MVGVDVLPNQRDLAHACIGETLRFGNDAHSRSRDFRAARIRHHAEGAEFVASFLDGDKRRNAACADFAFFRRGEMLELVFDRKFRVDDRAVVGACDQVWQPVIVLRTNDEIDGFLAADDFLAFGLRDTTGDRDFHIAAFACSLFLHLAQAAEFRINLLGGALANMTGVEDDEVRAIRALRLRVAGFRQGVRHTM